jgi:hypothetical protein
VHRVWRRIRIYPGPQINGAGKMSILMLATLLFAVPRVRCAREATAFQPLPGGLRSREITILSAGLDYMASFATLAGVELPKKDAAEKPIIFASYDLLPHRQISTHDLVLLHGR